MKDKFSKIIMNNRKALLVVLLPLLVIILSLTIVVLKINFLDTSKKNVGLSSEKADFDKKEAGAWNITKSAKWTAKGEAEITFDVDTIMKSSTKYTDVIFLLDVSGSMNGEKLDRVKADTTELINSLLSNDKNRAGLITFETNSQIVASLTNNKDELINAISNLTTGNMTNYYQALVNVDSLLKKYVKEVDRECVVLFLTDGYPNEGTPNEETQYNYLKNQYPFITVNGVQYEMGSNILEPIKKVSDNQYIADMETLNNVLFEASISPVEYENFMITDYIDTNYFYVESEKDINVRQGTITFDKDNQKVTWSIPNFKSGSKSKMTIKIKLKEELIGVGGTYPTNEKEEIKSKLDDITENVISTETPVLKDNYKVIYDGNAPAGCRVEGAPEEKQHTVFDVVRMSDSVPKCKGYQFRGWKITAKNIKMINDDYFVMPGEDVMIKAKWGKVGINKSMRGTVKESITLYKQVQLDYENNNHAKRYTGASDTFNGNQEVYYYYGDTPNNNVIFGGFCWRMVRTTDTGGVKMVYNGEPDSEGKCGSDRENHVGYGSSSTQTLSSSYMYGTDYTYDEATKIFTLSGDIENSVWSEATYESLIGRYTCINTTGDCSTLYYVDSFDSNTKANVLSLNSTTNYSSIGISTFNENDRSLADVGYMFNKKYAEKNISLINVSVTLLNSSSASKNYYYADAVKYDEMTNKYSLINPYKLEETDDYQSLVGKYTFRNSTDDYTSNYVSYIVGIKNSELYYFNMGSGYSGLDLETADRNHYFADSIVDPITGKHTIDFSNISVVKTSEWFNNYNNYKYKYLCGNAECKGRVYYINGTSQTSYLSVEPSYEYMFGNSFNYNSDTGEYTLGGEIQYLLDWSKESVNLKNAHYTCLNISGVCKKLSYVYYINNRTLYYINLENGKGVDDAINEMLYNEDVNKTNSVIKNVIDLWYSKNMTQYTDYLEDTVWCNSRRIIDLGMWNPNGGSLNKELTYWSKENNNNLTCPDKMDSFTVNDINGNGVLKYPVGLVTESERNLAFASSNSAISSGDDNWSLSPYGYTSVSKCFHIRTSGNNYNGVYEYKDNIYTNNGVHPTISLRAGIEYTGGDGTVQNPYVVDIDIDNDKYNINMDKNPDYYIPYESAYKDQLIRIKSNLDNVRVRSFKINGKLIKGNSFVMPKEDVTITDVELGGLYFDIKLENSNDIDISKNAAEEGEEITLSLKSKYYKVLSFKMNGKLIKESGFKMPAEDVIITDVVVVVVEEIIESEHNSYPNSLNSKVYGEKTFDGATSLTVELDYQTENIIYDWIYLYDSTGKEYGKYGGKTRKTETITIPGDYVKVVFRTDGSGNNYYGFKATITPNFD